MTDYEMMFVVKSSMEQEQIDELIGKVTDTIEKGSGVVLHLEKMGKRDLASEFNKNNQGYYFYFDFSADKSILDNIAAMVKINEDIITTLLVKLDSIKVTPKS